MKPVIKIIRRILFLLFLIGVMFGFGYLFGAVLFASAIIFGGFFKVGVILKFHFYFVIGCILSAALLVWILHD